MRILANVLTALLLAGSMLTFTQARASAGVLDATCTGAQTITYSPGLHLLTPRTGTTTGASTYSCLASVVSTGISGFQVTDSRSCTSATPSGETTTITWNTGQTSVLELTSTVATVGGITIVTKTGTVTSGLFAGDLAVMVVTGPTLSTLAQCLSANGLTQTNETLTLELTSV